MVDAQAPANSIHLQSYTHSNRQNRQHMAAADIRCETSKLNPGHCTIEHSVGIVVVQDCLYICMPSYECFHCS